jgi:hypothetical protein
MAKNQPDKLEPLEPEEEYFIKQITEGVFKEHWVIYTKTKWGDKWFNNFPTKEQAIAAAKAHKLNTLF